MACVLGSLLSLVGCKHGPGPRDTRALRRLCIYYGWPSVAGGARTPEQAGDNLGAFDVLVLGAGLQRPDHPDHAHSRELIGRLRRQVEIYGYVSLGPSGGSATELEAAVRAWKGMGAHGIFFDEAGYDFGTTRARQSQAFGAARANGLRSFANAFDPDDLFAERRDARHNPDGEASALGRGDAYLYESFVVRQGRPEDAEARRVKEGKLEAARRRGVRLFGVTTAAGGAAPDASLWEEARREARRLGFEGLGWGQPGFGAQDGRLPPHEPGP